VLAEQTIELMNALGIERAHLSGESLGGWVSGFLAVKYPERVGKLMLNTAGGVPIVSVKGRAYMDNLMTLSKKAAGGGPTFETIKLRIGWFQTTRPSSAPALDSIRLQASIFTPTMARISPSEGFSTHSGA